MNELRMYVESLFEGRVLTAETIELKEEMYGNMMARYEDYLAQGMDEAEALEKTKASITSVDDVMGEAEEGPMIASKAPQTTPEVPGRVDETVAMPKAAAEPGAPLPPSQEPVSGAATDGAARDADARHRGLKIGAVAMAAVVVVALIGAVALGLLRDSERGSSKGDVTVDIDHSAPEDPIIVKIPDDEAYDDEDAEDRLEREATQALESEIAETSSDELAPRVGTSLGDGEVVRDIVSELPLGYTATSVECDQAAGTVSIVYEFVDHYIDGDAIDRALSCNVVALFCVLPDAQTISVTLHEDDDRSGDVDRYAFERRDAERLLQKGAATQGVTALDGQLVESVDRWNSVRNVVTSESYADELVDVSEVG